MVGDDCRHFRHVYEPAGFDHCQCGYTSDATCLWSGYPRCPMGDNDLHAHPGCCDPNSSVSDREVWRETRLCVDADRISPGLPAVWFCLESTLLTPLSSDPGDRRRYS